VQALSATLDPNVLALGASRNIGTLATIERGGRPHLSAVNFTLDPVTGTVRISMREDRVFVHIIRRDPRASILVASPQGWTCAVLEGTVDLSPVAAASDDDTVNELTEIFRAIRDEDHPDWDQYRAQMVADRRLVARLHVESAYALAGPEHARMRVTQTTTRPARRLGPARSGR
jgi:PPOX class probable F420-dependent enzyme